MGEPNGRINTLLKGKSVPNNATLRRVCAAFNITLSTFYQTDGALVTLTEDQHKMLKDYSRLDSYCRSLASAYIQGLAEASVREKDKPRE